LCFLNDSPGFSSPQVLHNFPDNFGTGDLLSDDDAGPALSDEPECFWPEVSGVGVTESLAGPGVGLARARTRPNSSIVSPAGKPKSEGPARTAAEQVDLREAIEVPSFQFLDGATIDTAGRDLAGGNEVLGPVADERFDIVVEMHMPSFCRVQPGN
jgi:hypothetical protein